MSKEKAMKGKKPEKSVKQLLVIFLLVMGGCLLGGFLVGAVSGHLKELNGEFFAGLPEKLEKVLLWGAPVALILVVLVGTGLGLFYYFRAKKVYRKWDGEDEDCIAAVEDDLNYCVLVSNIEMVLDMFFMAAWMTVDGWYEQGAEVLIMALAALIFYLGGLAATTVIQYKVVELEKKINPEKRGNVLDLQFAKKWESSFDEREMMIAYQAAYKSHKSQNKLYMGLWLACLLGEVLLDFGLTPVLMVSIMWLVSVVTYQTEAMKLENNRKN